MKLCDGEANGSVNRKRNGEANGGVNRERNEEANGVGSHVGSIV
jgi:hypothetical protein